MRKKCCVCFVLALFLLSSAFVQAEKKPPLVLRVFLYDPCGGCATADPQCRDCPIINAFFARLSAMFKSEIDEGKIEIRIRNVLYKNFQAEHELYLKNFAVSEKSPKTPPQYFVGEAGWGECILKEEEGAKLPEMVQRVLKKMPSDGRAVIKREVKGDLLQPRSDAIDDIKDDDSLVVYFYKDYCPYCMEIKALMEGLPEFIYLKGGRKSRVRLVSLEKQDPRQMQVVQKYYDKLFVHPDRQFVPMVVIGKETLFLGEEIVPNLLQLLIEGEGQKTAREPLLPLKEK